MCATVSETCQKATKKKSEIFKFRAGFRNAFRAGFRNTFRNGFRNAFRNAFGGEFRKKQKTMTFLPKKSLFAPL